MSGVERFGASRSVPSRQNKQLTAIEKDARVQAHRVMAVAYVTSTALQAVTQMSMAADECAKAVPGAALRLAAIADTGTAATQHVLLDMGMGL